MSEDRRFSVHLQRTEGYKFQVEFDMDSMADLQVDEPPPLGEADGPNPARLVAVAAANCLSSSLLFCLQKTRAEPEAISAHAIGIIGRNKRGRLRLKGLEVELTVEGFETETQDRENKRLNRCLGLFEDFCVVTDALRSGIPIDVKVVDGNGNSLVSG